VLTRRELGLLVVLGDAGCSGHRFLYLSHPFECACISHLAVLWVPYPSARFLGGGWGF
jgi:hypothetical protein